MQHSPPRPPASPLAVFPHLPSSSGARATLFATGLFLAGLISGALAGRAAVARVQDPYTHVDLFARVLATVEEDYVEPVPAQELVDAGIRGMVERLDRQSRWLDPGQLRELRDDAEGASTGLGIDVGPAPNGIQVLSVAIDSQAAEDGLRPGDRILEVDGTPVSSDGLSMVRQRLSGATGQIAELIVEREGWDAPRTIRTARERIPRNVVEGALLERVAYVRVEHFQEGTASALHGTVAKMASELGGLHELDGLVMDLRDNPGGLLSEAVAVSDLFLDEGLIVSTQARRDGPAAEHYEATPGGLPPTLRMVVLVNGMSASASEIVAGALQDTRRATLVGEPTYGKGTVQKVYLVNAGSGGQADAALKLTVGRYYTPSGAPVAPREGRVPDHVIHASTGPDGKARLRARLEGLDLPPAERSALLGMLEPLDAPVGPAPVPWEIPAQERLPSDPALAFAVRFLSP